VGRVGAGRMLYQAYQAHCDVMVPVRALAGLAAGVGEPPVACLPRSVLVRNLTAAYEIIARAGLTHVRPPFGLRSIMVGNREVAVTEEAAHKTAFGTLLHFKKDIDTAQPRVILVAPLSGHFATLLRATVKTMLPDHDVYITDWHNARDIALLHGRFGFDDYIAHLIRFVEIVGSPAHLMAVCQPCVAALVAAAVMAQDRHPAQPRSITLMAGPIDPRVNRTKVNELAESKSIEWFENHLLASVPMRYPGAFRRVYPGFVQLAAFMSMNIDRHVNAQRELFDNLANGRYEKAQAIKAFYEEYFAVLDLTAEFYLETVRLVFQEHALARGRLQWRDRAVEPRAIRRTLLLTVEGERDDICAVGQTLAAHDLCAGLRPYLKRHHMEAGVGHYGGFSGKRWKNQIFPIVKNVILATEGARPARLLFHPSAGQSRGPADCARCDGLAIGRLPAPGAGAVAALHHPLLVDLGDDVAVAGEQRLGRAHLGAQRQLAFGEAIGAVLDVLGGRAVGLGAARTVGALVHFAARAEIADPRILRRPERTGVEAVAAADAQVLRMQHDAVGRRVEAVHRTDSLAGRIGAVHARHRHRALTRLPVVEGHDAPAVDAPRHVVLVLAGGDAGVALD